MSGENRGNGPKQWFEAWFDRDEYKVVYGHRDEHEARRVVDLIESVIPLAARAAVLDMGCGRGRHALEFARRGYQVTGIDLSQRSIEAARAASTATETPADFETGDMRETHCHGCFDLVANLFTAFGYFEDEAEHARAITAMANAVTPGGWFVQDFLNAERVRRRLVSEDHRTSGDIAITQTRTVENGRINKTILLDGPDGRHEFRESVRLLEIDDFDRLYRDVGLILHKVFGDYDGGPFTPDSPRLIMFAKKER